MNRGGLEAMRRGFAPGALIFLCGCLFIFSAVEYADAFQGFENRSNISREDLEALINRPNTSVTHGTLDLPEGEVLEGNVVVIDGDLEMQSGSSIKGDAIVVSGDALLNGECVIEGDLRVVAGFMYASDLAEIKGRTILNDGNFTLKDLNEETGQVRLGEMKDINRHRLTGSVFPGPFNRVDGHNFDFVLQYKRPEGVSGTAFEGTLRVPTEDTHDGFLQFMAGVTVPMMEGQLKLGLDAFKVTESEDDWRATDFESGVITFFSSNDDKDYYEQTGGSVGLTYELTEEISLMGGLSSAEYRSLGTRSPFTLFQRTDYRRNPGIHEGHLTDLSLGFVYDTRFDPYFPADAWLIEAGMRSGIEFLDGDHTYTIFEATARRHQKLTRLDFVDLRVKMAGSTDALPAQRTFSMGSYGGVRGKDFDSWMSPRGDRLLLANVEYRRHMQPLRYLESLFSRWWLVAFSDTGTLFVSENPEDIGTLLSDAGDYSGSGAGLGIAGSSLLPYVGLFAAKDLDTDSWRFIVRINRPF